MPMLDKLVDSDLLFRVPKVDGITPERSAVFERISTRCIVPGGKY